MHSTTAASAAAKSPGLWAHNQLSLQKVVGRQKRRKEAGRMDRTLRVINTQWLDGVDWQLLDARVTGAEWWHEGGTEGANSPSFCM